jgi:hypothetical protein
MREPPLNGGTARMAHRNRSPAQATGTGRLRRAAGRLAAHLAVISTGAGALAGTAAEPPGATAGRRPRAVTIAGLPVAGRGSARRAAGRRGAPGRPGRRGSAVAPARLPLSRQVWSPASGPPDRRIGSSGCIANTAATCSPRHQSADVLPAAGRLKPPTAVPLAAGVTSGPAGPSVPLTPPGPSVVTLVTRPQVSRTASPSLAGRRQPRTAARTRARACPTAAGPGESRGRRARAPGDAVNGGTAIGLLPPGV